jgi:hypothetical protein
MDTTTLLIIIIVLLVGDAGFRAAAMFSAFDRPNCVAATAARLRARRWQTRT